MRKEFIEPSIKAKALIADMHLEFEDNDAISYDGAKCCALKAINEVIKAVQDLPISDDIYQYYKKVEIELLKA